MLCVGHERPELVRFELLPKLDSRLVDIAGVVVRISYGSIAVSNREYDRTLACSISERLAEQVAELQVGDGVKMLCAARGDRADLLLVARLDQEQRPPSAEVPKPKPEQPAPAQAVVERTIAGVVAGLGESSVTVRGDAVEPLTRPVPGRLAGAVAELSVGQKVRMGCRGAAGARLELQGIAQTG
jgi:hypothetical protein